MQTALIDGVSQSRQSQRVSSVIVDNPLKIGAAGVAVAPCFDASAADSDAVWAKRADLNDAVDRKDAVVVVGHMAAAVIAAMRGFRLVDDIVVWVPSFETHRSPPFWDCVVVSVRYWSVGLPARRSFVIMGWDTQQGDPLISGVLHSTFCRVGLTC